MIQEKLIEVQNNDVITTNKTIAEISKDIELVYSKANNDIRTSQVFLHTKMIKKAAAKSDAAEIRGDAWADYTGSIFINEISLFNNKLQPLFTTPKDAFISYMYMCFLRRLDTTSRKVNMGIGKSAFTRVVKEDL